MNIKTIWLLMLLLSSSVYSTAQHHIEFTIQGLQKGENCILAHYYADQNKIIDTIAVNAAGKVVVKGPNSLPHGLYILVLPSTGYTDFVIPQNDQIFTIQLDTSLNPQNKQVQGSTDNTAFFELEKYTNEQEQSIQNYRQNTANAGATANSDELNKLMEGASQMVDLKRRKLIAQYPNTFAAKLFKAVLEIDMPTILEGDTSGARFAYYRTHYWDNFDLSDNGMLRSPLYHEKLTYYFNSLYPQTPDSIIPALDKHLEKLTSLKAQQLFQYSVVWATNHFQASTYLCMDKVVYHMAKDYYCAGKCFWADTAMVNGMCRYVSKNAATQCGEIAPRLVLVDSTFVREFDLYRITAKVTVLVFWDHQCGHCKQELPILKEMYQKMHSRGVEVYAVYTKSDWKGWKQYIQDNELPWINVMDAFGKLAYHETYDFGRTPQVFVLDHEKRIVLKNPPAKNVEMIVDVILQDYE